MVLTFSEIARRAETGPLIMGDDFHRKILTPKTMDLLKEIKIKFDPKTLVNTENSVADEIWEAGYQLFLETGIYAVNSRRRVEFTDEEVNEALKHYKTNFEIGQGKDRRLLYNRKVEDSRPPLVFAGPMNADVTEDMIIKINEGFAQEPLNDILFLPGHIRKIDGVEVRMDSAQEVKAVIRYARAGREAIRRIGRPGMPIVGLSTMGLTSLAASNELWGFRRFDPRAVLFIAELGLDDIGWARLSHFHEYGCPIYIAFTPLIGGYAGGPVGTAILGIAYHLAGVMLGAAMMHMGPQHVKYGQQTNMHSLWLASVVKQAIARHTPIVSLTSHTCTGRPGLKQYFYEIANLVMSCVTSGSHICGPRPAMPVRLNHVSPLTGRWFAEMGHAASKLTRKKAGDLVLQLYEFYKDKLEFDKVQLGNTFEEVYDIDTLTPIPSHFKQYQDVYNELKEMGVPLT